MSLPTCETISGSDSSLPDIIYEDDIFDTLVHATYFIFFNQSLSDGEEIIIQTLLDHELATQVHREIGFTVLKLTTLGVKARDHLLVLERTRRKVMR